MLKKVLYIVAAIVVILVVVVAMQPDEYSVVRSATIRAPVADVFAQVNDFHNWQAWSPWAKLDPAAKNTFEGPSAGTGAIFKWSGNSDVGEGTSTITESRPNELIRIRLDFLKPFENSSTSEFNFKPEGDQTVVTWSMSGKHIFIGKAMCLVMDMDKMLGSQFEQGFTSLKSAVEAAGK